jgi:hypothetical protein
MAYEDYAERDGELNHVHVEIPYAHLDGAYGHMARIAERGVTRIIAEGGWYIDAHMERNANFVYNWGRGPTVKLRNGKVEA